jgi:putative membrane protein
VPEQSSHEAFAGDTGNQNHASDHLANERTFLAWVRTGIALVVFGFAIGRFAIAIREFMQVQGRVFQPAGLSVWFGTIAIVSGVVLIFAGLLRYRRTRALLESGRFEPAGFALDLIGILTAMFGMALAGYLLYIGLRF